MENALVFDYEDFGPQVVASEIVGVEWWQWQTHGDSKPIECDVKVVVYRGIALKAVQEKYPLDSEQNKDYRYLEYEDALAYLDRKIDENVIDAVTDRLKGTRQNILEKLGDRD